jgi:N,N-dimethylformamidase
MNAVRPLAYCDQWSFDPGTDLDIKISGSNLAKVQLLRLSGLLGQTCPTDYLSEALLPPENLELKPQSIGVGSYAITDRGPRIDASASWSWTFTIYPTLAGKGCVLQWGDDGLKLELDGTSLLCRLGGTRLRLPVDFAQWSEVSVSRTNNQLLFSVTPKSGSAWYREGFSTSGYVAPESIGGPLVFGRKFNGKIGAPCLRVDGEPIARWDFASDMQRQSVQGEGLQASRLALVNAPRRAVTGVLWDGTTHSWVTKPDHYDAIHFHDDDLDDCRWDTSARIKLPKNARSGIYAVRVQNAGGVHHVPIFIRSKTPGQILFLASTMSYLAYSNSIWASPSGAEMKVHYPEEAAMMSSCGLSMYSRHSDGSGIGQASMRRPILNTSPGFLGEQAGGQVLLNDDLRIVQWLEHRREDYGIITDHDLHMFGNDPLKGCNVLITGSHPEYHSQQSLDAIEYFLQQGGRVLYLGGNGFYWRVSTLPEAPHVMELRRAEGGIRIWDEPAGEYHHQSDGQLGGLWRRLGRPPNRLVGVGFTAQGSDADSRPYERTSSSEDPRVRFLFDGVCSGLLGASASTYAAGGYELDRADRSLGTPAHALVVARTLDFEKSISPVNEERLTHTLLTAEDPLRADLTFFETPSGGAVLSAGSVLFAACLDQADGIGQLAGNALTRFANQTPFAMPPQQENVQAPGSAEHAPNPFGAEQS